MIAPVQLHFHHHNKLTKIESKRIQNTITFIRNIEVFFIWCSIEAKGMRLVWFQCYFTCLWLFHFTERNVSKSTWLSVYSTPYASKQIYRLCERITSGGFSHNTQILITWNFDCTQALWIIFKQEKICETFS